MKVGDKVVCLYSEWEDYLTGERTPNHPSKDEIVTISGFKDENGIEGLILVEYGGPFAKFGFRPIDYSIGEKVCEYITKECETIKTPELV